MTNSPRTYKKILSGNCVGGGKTLAAVVIIVWYQVLYEYKQVLVEICYQRLRFDFQRPCSW